MAITLYRAPNCIRCRITHEFMDARGINYGSYDLEADKDIVNGFYRANRKYLHRNETGVEFPMFHDDDGDVVLQGTGVIIAYLLSGKALGDAGAVSESKMLHGWISGLNVSKVPAGEEDHFVEPGLRVPRRRGRRSPLQGSTRQEHRPCARLQGQRHPPLP